MGWHGGTGVGAAASDLCDPGSSRRRGPMCGFRMLSPCPHWFLWKLQSEIMSRQISSLSIGVNSGVWGAL